MSYSQLLKLNSVLSEKKIEELEDFFCQLTPNTSDKITVEKIASFMRVNYAEARKILMECKRVGILKIRFAARCPECGALIKKAANVEEMNNIDECYICGSEIEISDDDIILLFALNDQNRPFEHGQRKTRTGIATKSAVAQEDSLKKFLEDGNINDVLYNPTDDDYAALKELCEDALRAKSSTEKGITLEKAVNYLFNMGKTFNAKEVKTSINQIDCLVKNKCYFNYGVFEMLGGCFYVECKNETKINKTTNEVEPKKPLGTYISKLHSIILEAKGRGQYVKFGIIVSRGKAPTTYHEHAVKYRMLHNVIIIHITIDEILNLATSKGNLLDLIEEKAMMIITDIKEFDKAVNI